MTDVAPNAEPAASPRAAGTLVRALLWLVALGALALAGLAAWRLEIANPHAADIAAVAARADALEATQAQTARGGEAASQRVDALEATVAALSERLDGAASALAEALAGAETPPTPAQWRLAEVEYLLRVANHRLAMERDIPAAEELLAGADRILAELDDFAYHEVRALLARERLALEGFRGVDTQGVYLRLEAMKGLIEALPLRLPAYIARHADAGREADAAEPEAAPEDADQGSALDAAVARLSSLVRFRRHDLPAAGASGAVPPLLAPEEARYLEQHLLLAIERAQLALLKGDQAIFAANLGAAGEWLHAHVDPDHHAAAELQGAIEALSALDLEAPLPDIAGSLGRLRELRSGAGAEAPQ